MLWMFIRVWDIVDAHRCALSVIAPKHTVTSNYFPCSGYDFPWVPRRLLPFASSADAHDAHHSLNTGNYGSMFVHLDKLFGTEIPPAVMEAVIHAPRKAAAEAEALRKATVSKSE